MIRDLRALFLASSLLATGFATGQDKTTAPKDSTAAKTNNTIAIQQGGFTYNIDADLAKKLKPKKKNDSLFVVSGSGYDDHWVMSQSIVGEGEFPNTLHTVEAQVRSMDRHFESGEVRARAETFTRNDDKSRSITFLTVQEQKGKSELYAGGWSPVGSIGFQRIEFLRQAVAVKNEEYETVDTLTGFVNLTEDGAEEMVVGYRTRYSRSAGTAPIQNDVVTVLFEAKHRVMKEASQYAGMSKNNLDISNIGFARAVYRGAGHQVFDNNVTLDELGLMAQAADAFYSGDVIERLYREDPKVVNAYVKGTLALIRDPQDSTLSCGVIIGYTDDGVQMTRPDRYNGEIRRLEMPRADFVKNGAVIDILRMSDPKIAELASTSGNDNLNLDLPAGLVVYSSDTTNLVKEMQEFMRVYGSQQNLQNMIAWEACIGVPGEDDYKPFFGGKSDFEHNLHYDRQSGKTVLREGATGSGSGGGNTGSNNGGGRTYQDWRGHVGPVLR